MKTFLNIIRFNGMLVKPYWKYYLLMLAMAVGISQFMEQGSITFFLVFYMIMTLSYPFQLEEKNNGTRLYGLIPVKRSVLVIGRYAFFLLIALVGMLVGFLFEFIMKNYSGQFVSFYEILIPSLIAFGTFAAFTAFILPGYYKYGSIKARWLMFVPMMLLFGFFTLVNKIAPLKSAFQFMISNGWMFAFLPVVFLAVSLWTSIRIYNRKEF